MSSGFTQFSFGKGDKGVGGIKKRFKMETGQSARVSLAWWPTKDVDGVTVLDMEGDPGFVGAQRHFLKGVGYFINKGPEYTKIANEAPKMRVATIVVVWPMNSQGALDKAAIKAGQFQVMPWVIDGLKYETLKPIHQEWNLGEVDLIIKCQDGGFQKMTFTPSKGSLLRNIMNGVPQTKTTATDIVDQVMDLSAVVAQEIGKEMTIDQIREKLSGSGGGSPVAPTGDSASTEDIDDLMDDLLDG